MSVQIGQEQTQRRAMPGWQRSAVLLHTCEGLGHVVGLRAGVVAVDRYSLLAIAHSSELQLAVVAGCPSVNCKSRTVTA